MPTSTSSVLRFLLGATIAIGSAACTSNPVLPSATITSLSITGAPPVVGATAQFAASVVLASAAAVQDITTLVTWQSANNAIATVSKNGLVTGVSAGSTTLTATYNGSSVTATVAINAAP
jgi:uncharacterized protein YjdB